MKIKNVVKVMNFQALLRMDKALKEAGVKEGDTVRVYDWELEWYD